MFYDQATIHVRAGKGGDGLSSFRRESMVPMGGPDGGNGGRGGDVILVVNKHMNTLSHFQQKRKFLADDGRNGGSQDKTGRGGKPKYIEVPPGTIVRDLDTNAVLADLIDPDQQFVAAKGGRGGRGNAMFATSTHQAPRHAENGAPGEVRTLKLELKLIADIGFVGLPNAGKSTLLSVLTAAKPKIADYPFTTLQPNLGVAQIAADRTVVLADIPGLIEGASQGVGLGHEFLRHIERTRVIIHLLDGMSEDPLKDFHTINAELAAFGLTLAEKPQIIAMTKMDLPDARAAFDLYVAEGHMRDATRFSEDELYALAEQRIFARPPLPVLPISSANGEHVRDLVNRAVRLLDLLPPLPETEITPEPVLVMEPDQPQFEVKREGGGYRIFSDMLERKVLMTRSDTG